MIKKTLKTLASIVIGLSLVACVNGEAKVKKVEPTEEELATLYKQELKAGEKWGDVKIENRSDCLMVAVTILEIVNIDSETEALELVFGGWYMPTDSEDIRLIIGRKYIILVEAYFYDKTTGKATAKAGQQMKVGELVDDPNNDILIHCIHTEPKEV